MLILIVVGLFMMLWLDRPRNVNAAIADLTGRKVTLDPGHGWSDSGGASANGMLERVISLDIANLIKPILEEAGIEVSMTRIGDEPTLPLSTAAIRANQFQADIVVSIHTNAGGGTGTESCFTVGKSTSSESRRLASLLTQRVSTQLDLNLRGDFPENHPTRCGRGRPQLYIHDMNPPATIIETAFIDGALDNDVAKLRDRRADFANAISQAIFDYFGTTSEPPSIVSYLKPINLWLPYWYYVFETGDSRVTRVELDGHLLFERPSCAKALWLGWGSHTLTIWYETTGNGIPQVDMYPAPFISPVCSAEGEGNPPPAGSNPLPGRDTAIFTGYETLPDGTTVSPNQTLVKTWRVRNSGTSTWDGYKLKFISGKQMQGLAEMGIPTTAPGATVDLTLNLIAPTSLGTQTGTWQIVNRQGGWVQGGQLWINVNMQDQNNNIILTTDPSSPASASQVRIYALVNNFPNLRALRVLVDGQSICELGAPEITDCTWNTNGYSSGQHTIVAEADDWIGVPWDSPRRRSLVYQLNGSAISNHAPDRPTLQSPYNWYLKDAAGSATPVQMCVNSVSDPDGNAVQYWFELLNIILDPVQNSGWVSSNCYEPTLAPGGYAWRVKARDNLGSESDWSADTWNFNVASGNVSIGEPTVYQATDPDNTHVCVPVTYGGIQAPEVRAFINLAADGTESGEWALLDHYGPNTTPDCTQPNVHGFWIRSARYLTGNHVIQIRADKRDSGITDTRTFTHTIPYMRPPSPQLVTPSTIETNGTWWNTPTITFRWNEALRAENYQLRASRQSDLWNDPSPLVDVILNSSETAYVHIFGQDYEQLYWSVRAINSAGAVDSGLGIWFGIDRVVPSCAVQSLADTTWENIFQVNWSGTDNSAGIRTVDIQFKDSVRDEWADWLLGVPVGKTFDLFTGQPGHTYHFRCRATDQAGNAGNYPTNADTFIRIDPTARPLTPFWNSAYSNKHNITILNNMSDVPLPAGYPVHLHFDSTTTPTAAELYNASQATTKCDDLRITYNNATELDRLVDSCSSTAIDIWFRTQISIPSASSNNTAHQLYYGNPAAINPPASHTNVFWPEMNANTLRYYPMHEGTGTTLFDAAGHSDATMSSALSWTQAGKFGAAVQFPTDEGAEPRPAIDDGSTFMPENAFTVEFWLKRGLVDGGSIANQIVQGNPPRWSIFIDGGSLRLSVWPNSTAASSTVENNRNLNEQTFYDYFHHFAVTFDGGNQVRFYIDGQLDVARTLPQTGLTTSDSPLRIGASGINSGRLSGQMFGFVLSEGVKTDFWYGGFAAITIEPSLAAGALVTPPVAGAADLAVIGVNAYPNPDGGVLVEVVVQNQGNISTQNGFFTDLYLDNVPTEIGDFIGSIRIWVNDPIDAGAQVTLTTVVTDLGIMPGQAQSIAAEGETSGLLYAQTDSFGSVSEPDEVNNFYTVGAEICLTNPDAYESGDTFENASAIDIGQSQIHNFDRPGDRDWIRFNAEAGTPYSFYTLNLGTSADTTLSLYDTDGLTLLLSNDDFNESLASQVEWTAPTTGTYYVLINHWNPNAGGCGTAYTFEVSVLLPTTAPSDLSALSTSWTQINLSWIDNSINETGFRIERSPNGTTDWTEIDTVGADETSYHHTGLTCSTIYYYRVRAFRSADNWFSDYSNVARGSTKPCSPPNAAPGGNYFTTSTPTLTWNLVSWAIRYEIQISDNRNFTNATTYSVGNVLALTLSSPLADRTYYWRVHACSSVTSCGLWSIRQNFIVATS